MTKQKISWGIIETALKECGKDQVWLGEQLGVGKGAVTNWKDRDKGVPLEYVVPLSEKLGLSFGELLGADDPIDAPKRPDNQPLSDEARELISCVARLDALGEIPRQMFIHHKGLLLLSVVSAELQDAMTGRKRLAKTEHLLKAPRSENSEGPQHAGKKHKQ